MLNPWSSLPTEPDYVLPSDRAIIAAANAQADYTKRIHLQRMPKPYHGRPDAPVVLLAANPGVRGEGTEEQGDATGLWRLNLLHRMPDYFFCPLHPAHESLPTYQWWSAKLRALIDSYDLKTIANNVQCIQYFPYHSRSFPGPSLRVPSQEYSFHLVRKAIARGAEIVVMRSGRHWYKAVPELITYRSLYEVRNKRNPTISLNNCPGGFAAVIRRLAQ